MKVFEHIAESCVSPEITVHEPPVKSVSIDSISLQVDLRDQANFNALNPLTSDPYTLWGLELGWPKALQTQTASLLKVQEKRFERTGILTAVNEDSLDRPPYFLYHSVYANGEVWPAPTTTATAYPELRTLSTKAAFAWSALFPQDPYAQRLRSAVQCLNDLQRGYFAGRYEDATLGPNKALSVNTNAVVLESLLYKTRRERPLIWA